MRRKEIDETIAILHTESYFRAEYEQDGYIQIHFLENDSYEVKIEGVSYLDQPTAAFYRFTKAELIRYIFQNAEKIGKWSR